MPAKEIYWENPKKYRQEATDYYYMDDNEKRRKSKLHWWSEKEILYLKKKFPTEGVYGFKKKYPNRSDSAILFKATELGLICLSHEEIRVWNNAEIFFIKEYYSLYGAKKVREFLPHRTCESIRYRARCLRIKFIGRECLFIGCEKKTKSVTGFCSFHANKIAVKKYSQTIKGKIARRRGCKKFRLMNPDKIREHNHKHKMARLNISGSHTFEEWIELRKSTNGICPMCKKYVGLKKLSKDHIIPLQNPYGENGTDNIDNIQSLCKPCNSKKNNRIIVSFRKGGN